jgi:Multicopper oxidase
MFAGSIGANATSGQFMFNGLNPGNYQLNLTNAGDVYLPPTSARISSGVNVLNLTVYQLTIFRLTDNSSLSFNGTQPAPSIYVRNGTATRLVIQNNTTQVFNVAVVASLYNTTIANTLFDSLSSTISAGGSVNDTFIVSEVGSFYYQSMTGNQARQGEYGSFIVTPLRNLES